MNNLQQSIPSFEWVAIEKIQIGRFQPRQVFDDEKIKELAQSIAQYGILQPLLLNEQYQLVAGERRWRAAKMLGLKELPCMILSIAQTQHALLSILENIQREQIEPLEEALAYQRLQKEFSWTQEHIAKLLGKSRTHVTNMLRLLKLSPQIIESLDLKVLSYGHARALIGLPEEKQLEYQELIIQRAYSVRQIEKLVQQDKKSEFIPNSERSHFLKTLGEHAGTVVEYESYTNGEGWLKFKFFNQDSLEGLLQRLGFSYDE
jgi:ParB family transcriptional regulator, chromosome partitioning protein